MNRIYSLIGSGLFLLGIICYAVYHEYIIINPKKTFLAIQTESLINKKKVQLSIFKETWHHDYVQLLISGNSAHNAQLLINRWLENALDENIIKKKTVLQNSFVTHSNELILSFDRSPFAKESSTFDKWMIIEGILKTIKENIPAIKKVRFLIAHQPLIDPHLDFSNVWPVEGFSY